MLVAVAASVVAFIAAIIRGASGFGFALTSAPILALLWAPEISTPVVLLLDVIVAATLVKSGVFEQMRWPEAIAISVCGLLGSVVGTLFVSEMPHRYAEIGLNLAVLISAVAALMNLHARFLDHPVIGSAVSLVTGIVIGAFAVGGPLILAWLLAVRRTPAEIRGTLTLMFAASDMVALSLRVVLGTFPLASLEIAVLLTPIVILGVYVGGHAFRRVDARLWKRSVAALLVIVALVGLGRAGMELLGV